MNDAKRQRRANVAERLRNITLDPEGGSHANLDAICRAVYVPSYGWTRGACDGLARTLIGLLTDEPNDELAPESGVSADAAESNDVISEYLGQSRDSGIDARECQPIRDLMDECAELERTVDRLTEENDALREWKACYERACAERDECADAADAAEKRVKELENELRNMAGARDHWKDAYSIVVGQLGKLRDRERELEAELEVMRTKQAMPKGVVWPHFEDGACVGIGDAFVGCDGEPHELACVKFLDDGYWMMEGTSDQGGVGFDGFTSLGCGFWPYGETFERPPLLASDGQPIERGETLYGLSDGKKWTVTGISHDKKYPVLAECRDAFPIEVEERALKPRWLSHGRPDSLERALADLRRMADFLPDGNWQATAHGIAERIEKLAKEGA